MIAAARSSAVANASMSGWARTPDARIAFAVIPPLLVAATRVSFISAAMRKKFRMGLSTPFVDKERKPSIEVPDPKADGGRRKVAVKLGISNGVKTELAEGLREGDRVVLQ